MIAGARTKKSRKRKARSGERIASSVILMLLLCIGLVVYLTGRSDESGLEAGRAGDSSRLQDLAPPEIDGLKRSRIQAYQSDNLYEYINGQAPHYIDFGFRELQVVEYSPPETDLPSLIVDIYDMSLRRNAYGLFMSSLPPEEEAIDLGNAGYSSGNLAVFWKGPFYVRVTSPTATNRGERVREAARRIAGQIEDESSELGEFSAFPPEDLLPETTAFSKSSVFGLPYLQEAFIATYEEAEGDTYRLFFTLQKEEVAAALLSEHAEFLRSGDGLVEVRQGEEESLVWGEDRYVGSTFFLARDGIVAGSIRISDREAAERTVRRLLDRVVERMENEEM